MYEAEHCSQCLHATDEAGCAVMMAHRLKNYDECNNEDSILHMLIPKDDKGFPQICRMFVNKNAIKEAE